MFIPLSIYTVYEIYRIKKYEKITFSLNQKTYILIKWENGKEVSKLNLLDKSLADFILVEDMDNFILLHPMKQSEFHFDIPNTYLHFDDYKYIIQKKINEAKSPHS